MVIITYFLHHQAETQLQKASVDASRTSRTLEEEMDSFEKKKLADIKVCWWFWRINGNIFLDKIVTDDKDLFVIGI